MKTILLNPGPVNVTDRVRAALSGPDLCHREPEYFDLQDAIRARILEAFGAELPMAAICFAVAVATSRGARRALDRA